MCLWAWSQFDDSVLPAWSQFASACLFCVWACDLAAVCLQFASRLVTLCLCLGPVWEHWFVCLWLAFFVLTGCFHLCQSLLVLIHSLRASFGGIVACCQLACNLLPAWSQCSCAWTHCESMCVCVCVLVAWSQFAYTLCPAWSHFACSWILSESIVCALVLGSKLKAVFVGLSSLCLQFAYSLLFSLAPASMCLDPVVQCVSRLVTVILCMGPIWRAICVGLWFGFSLLTFCLQFGYSFPVLAFSLLAGCFQLGHNVIVLGFNVESNGVWACGLLAVCLHFASSLVTVCLCLAPVLNQVFVCLVSVWWQCASSLVTVC